MLEYDGSEPSTNSVASMNLMRFHSLLNKSECRDKAGKIFVTNNMTLMATPVALAGMLCAYMNYLQKSIQVK